MVIPVEKITKYVARCLGPSQHRSPRKNDLPEQGMLAANNAHRPRRLFRDHRTIWTNRAYPLSRFSLPHETKYHRPNHKVIDRSQGSSYTMTLMNSEKPLLYLVSVNDGAENEHQIESAPEPEVTEFGYTLEELQAAARRQDAWLAKAVRHHDVERYAEDHHATYRDGQIWLEEHHRSNTASREEDDGPDLR